jgi:hypothetical protein
MSKKEKKKNKQKKSKKQKKDGKKKQLKKGKKQHEKKKLAKRAAGKKKTEGKKSKKNKSKKNKSDKKSPTESSDSLTTATMSVAMARTPLTTEDQEMQPMQMTQSTGNGNYGTNYAIFEWDGGSWGLVENHCNYGCIPQRPDSPGSFPGERTVTACQAQVEGMSCPPSE